MLPWDARLARAAAAFAAVAAFVALVVVVATDEGGAPARRLALLAAVAPALGALGSASASGLARARGELRALAALGVRGGRAVLGASVGGAAVGLLGPALLATGRADVGALFPRLEHVRAWSFVAGVAHEASLGVALEPNGDLRLGTAVASHAATDPSALLVALALTVAALVFAAWAARVEPGPRSVVVGFAAAVACVVAFQLVASGVAPPAALLAAPALLVVDLGALSSAGRS